MHVLTMGNPHAGVSDGTPVEADDAVTTVDLLEDWSTLECFQTITLPDAVGDRHFVDGPSWVSCPDRPALAALLAEHYGCEVRDAD